MGAFVFCVSDKITNLCVYSLVCMIILLDVTVENDNNSNTKNKINNQRYQNNNTEYNIKNRNSNSSRTTTKMIQAVLKKQANAVSYTHLDVYKRQLQLRHVCKKLFDSV